jgi:hypothetical protein
VLAEGRFDDRSDRVSPSQTRWEDIRRVTFGIKGKGTRAGTSCKPDFGPRLHPQQTPTRNRRRLRGEVFGSWKVRASARRLNGSVFVRVGGRRQRARWERASSRPRGFRLAPQRPELTRSPRKPLGLSERQSHGAWTNPSSCPARATVSGRHEPGCVIVFGERTFRFVVCRFLVRWASCVGLFAETGARYRVAPSSCSMVGPKGSAGKAEGARQESRHTSAGRSGGVSNHPGRTWSRRGLLFA